MERLWGAIQTFMRAVGIGTDCGALCLFENLLGAVMKLPDLAAKVFEVVVSLEDYVGPNATKVIESDQLRRVLQAAYSIVDTARNDIQRMYTLVFDTVKVTLPELAKNVTNTVKLVVEAIKSLPDCPVAATYALIVSKDNIQSYLARIILLKNQFEEAFYISTGELPPWLNPTKEITRILGEFVKYIEFHFKVMLWGCDQPSPSNPQACAINRTLWDQEMSVNELLKKLPIIGEVLDFVQTTIIPPIQVVTELYSNLLYAWDVVKMVYDKARAIFDFLFGVKFHKTFGRNIRDGSNTCGTGLYPSTDHRGAIGSIEEQSWGSGIDLLIIMSDQCDLKCQENPQQQYKKDSYEKSGQNSGSSGSSSTVKKDKYVTVPLKGIDFPLC